MDRGKLGGPRKTKPKGPPPTGELIALGSKPTPMATDPKLPSQQRKLSATGSSLLPSSSSAFAAKKPKLGVLTPLGRPAEGPKKQLVPARESSVAPILVPASDLIDSILDAEAENNDDRVDSLIVGAINTLKSNKAKPDQAVFLSLMFLAKTKPLIFLSEGVTESFCSLLKRDVSFNFKSKGNPLVVVLTCNILMSAYQEEDNWPDNFVKVFVEDSLGERVWVDNPECKEFVANIQTAFNTRLPTKSGLTSDPSGRPPSSTPEHCPSPTQFGDDDDRGSDLSEGLTTSERLTPDDQSITPRYTFMQESIEGYILDTLKDQLTRRQAMDNLSRNLIRLMTVTCGYAEVRLMAVQRLEMWLQNPKLTRPAQELLMSVCLNCVTQDPQDVEVVSALIRVRLKTKPLINHYNSCMRELLNAHSENLSLVLKHTIYNELSNSRNPNNMSLLAVLFQHSPEEAAKFLAVVFQELLTNREDYLRAVRALLREIIRALRGDLNFAAFCRSLMQERSESQFMEMEGHLKERLLLQLTDLICLGCLLSVTAAVKEAASALARGEKKVDLETLRRFQLQSSVIQRDSVWWLHTIAPGMFKLNSTDYVQCIQKVLFMESAESYYSKDNWPPEGERAYLLRLVSEVPVQEDTLMRLLVIGLSRDLPLSAVEALDLADQVVRRAASLHSPDFDVLPVERIQLVDAVLNLCAYHHPENIQLPQGYEPPTLAISNLYWKGWMLLLTVSAFNPANIGHAAWEHYPQLKCFMEMVMTNDYDWPPGTLATEEKKAELINKELQICELEKQEILEFESHLAAASTKVSITEANSLLIAQLISMDPSGVARRPPPSILQQLRSLNKSLKLGHLLCRCRAPDFLLDIIQRQGTSQSMPWLAELVESSEGSMEVLPVQCLCEFLLHDIGEEAAQQEDEELLEMEKSKMEMERLKQKSRKQDQLRRRLQTLLYGPDSQPNQTHEVLQYFLRRLGAQQRAGRNLAAKALSMLLAPRTPPRQRSSKDSSTSEAPEQDKEMAAAEEEEDAVAMVMEEEAVVCPPELKGFHWLLVELPKLPHFNIVLATTVYALRQACQTETDPMAVSAYMLFLSQHAPPVVSDMADLALDMATVIVERPTIIAHLMPRGVGGRDGGLGGREEADIAFCALLAIYIQYFKMVLQPKGEPAWSESQDQIFLRWSTGEGATMHILVVHAMIILLTYGEPRGDNEYSWLLEVWFPIQGQPPAAYLVDTSEEALLLPDWLKLRMIRSHVQRLVDAALLDLDPAQLVLFVQSFGIPMDSMSKLLICLDEAVTHNPLAMQQAVVDKAYMSQLVEVQHMRGVVGGEKFKAFLNDNGSLSTGESTSQGAVADVEMISPVEEERGLSRRPQPSYRPPSTEAGWMQEIVKLFPVDPGVQITSAMKKDIVKGIQLGLSKEISAVTRGDEHRESLGDVLIATILQMCGGDYSIPFTSSLHQNSHLSCPIFRLLMAREVRLTCPSHLSILTCLSSPVCLTCVCVGGGTTPSRSPPAFTRTPTCPAPSSDSSWLERTPHGPRGKTHLSISPVYPHLSVSPVCGGGGYSIPFTSSLHQNSHLSCPIFRLLMARETPHGPRGKTHLSISPVYPHLSVSPVCVGGDYSIPFTSSLHQNSHLSCPIFRLLMAREVRLTCPSHLSILTCLSHLCAGGDYSIPFPSSLHQNSHLSCPIFRLLMAREVRLTCPSHLSILTCLSHLCAGGDYSIPFTSSLHQNSHLSCPIFRLLMAREVRLTCPSHLSILTCVCGGDYSILFISSLHQNSHLSCPIFRLLMAREVRLTCPSHLSILTCLSHLCVCGGGDYSIPFTSSLHQNSHLSCPIFRLLMAREVRLTCPSHLSILTCLSHLCVCGGGDYSIPFTSSLHQNSHLSCPIFRLLMAREVRLTCPSHLSILTCLSHLGGGGDYSIPFTSSLHQNSHLSCPIFRLLMARENVMRKRNQSSGFPALVSRLVKYHSSRGTLTTVLKQYHRQLAPVQKDINVLSALQAVLEAPYQHQQNLVRQAIAAIKHADPTQPLDFGLVHRVCALLCRFNSPLLEEFLVACLTLGLRLPPGHAGKGEVMTQSHTQLLARMLMEQRGVSAGGGRVPSPVSGLLVDWLETSDTEIVSTCPDHQLHLLFARDGGRSSTQPYLLALLTHQTNYGTLHRCINFLLQGEGKDRISSTAALDFLWACIHIPKVWQGRDTKVPQRCLDKEKILQLRPSQLCCLVDYILQEAGESCPASSNDPGSLKESLSDSIQARLPLLLSCFHGNKKEVSAEVLAYLQKKMTGQDKDSVVAMATRQFLLLLYIRAPHMHTHDSVSEVISMEMEAAKGGYSQLDSFTHRLLSVLGNCAAGKVCEDRMYDTNILCRKLATVHPALLLRQLPMIAALLRGRVHLNFDEFVHRHHFLFFTHVLGLLELLVPHVFRKEHPLEDVLESYFDLLKEHYSSRRELGALVNKVIQFLHQFTSNDPQRAVALLQKHSATLHHVSKQYPDLSLLKSLLAGISLPSSSSDSVDETSSSSSKEGGLPETGRASPIPLVVPPASGTPWTAVQLAPFLKRIRKGQDHDDVLRVLHDLELTSKRRVDVLEHFLADLKRLMSDSHDDCRNIAHNLVMRHIKSKPSCAAEFLDSYLHCLDTNDHNIIKTTLRNLADYIVLCQEHSNVLVRKAFAVGVQMKIDTSNIIADAINMLRLEGYND
ncbi:integrator complex subunit 1-like [Branchiostoma lanceolatum]|uniref:integrator complex subunit 1-like n=1 Tax=Branchiostoma lanceolatum TaxID=7740 RepID=UPI0034532C69